jgi:hypothetical protein
MGLLLWIAGTALGAVAGDTVGSIATFAAIAVVLLYFVALPRLRGASRLRELWREGLKNGDRDGTVRRALASVGLQLPRD